VSRTPMVSPPMLQLLQLLLLLPRSSTLLVVGSHCFFASGCGWGSVYDEVVAVVPLIVVLGVVVVLVAVAVFLVDIEAGDR
jgi:hypothetical protein